MLSVGSKRPSTLFVRTCWRFLVGAWYWPHIDPRHRASSPRDLWRVARLYERTRP